MLLELTTGAESTARNVADFERLEREWLDHAESERDAGARNPRARKFIPLSNSPRACAVGFDILIVEFQAYIVFAIYRMIFGANIAQISLR